MEAIATIVESVSRDMYREPPQPTSSTPGQGSDVCPACDGLGWQRVDVPYGHPLFGKLVHCEVCGEARHAEHLRRLSRLSDEMQSWRLNDFKPRGKLAHVPTHLWQALGQGRGWVTLSGPPGTGKTFLLGALTNEARIVGKAAVYTTMADLLSDLRDSFNPESGTNFSGLLADISQASVLCLDEIEKFRTTPWAEEVFFRLVEERYRNWTRGLTVLATNRRIGLGKPILSETGYPGYLESRIMDGRFMRIDDFWSVSDARPALR